MRVLITGGAGFIGSHLADACLARGDEVYVLDDLSTGSIYNIEHLKDHPEFHYTIDRVQSTAVTAELVDRVDVVFHLAGEPGVFTFSMHAERNFPVRKVPSSLDIGLPDATGDDAYLGRLGDVLPELAERARPQLVFYNAGVDPHRDDRLGRLALSDDGLRIRDEAVVSFFRCRGIPLCGVIGGGYSRDMTALAGRHAVLFEVAAGWC